MQSKRKKIPSIKQDKIYREGLSDLEALKRLETYGPNLIEVKSKKHLLISLLEEFKDLMVLILIGAAILALINGEISDASVIFFIVILNALIGFIQKYKAEKAIEALRKLIASKAKVIRNGIGKEIEARQIVPGDIIILGEGDSIPADAELIECNELETQESSLTGESIPIQKSLYNSTKNVGTDIEKKNMVFMGTAVTHGNGLACVVKTGMNTQMGKIATLTITTKKDLSPLEKELQSIGVFVGKLSFIISVILLLVGYFIQGKDFIDTLLFATSVAVAAVPEGLPATVTIALAIGVQRLARKNAIVKQLSSVETLGATTVICSDKTGTLTKNEMTMEEIYWENKIIVVKGVGYKPNGSFTIEKDTVNDSLKRMMITAGLCNNAKLIEEKGIWKVLGDPTEGALLTLVEKSPFKLEKIQEEFEKIYEIPFDSFRKKMSVILKEKTTGKYYIFCKGSPDSILAASSKVNFNNKIISLNSKEKQKIINQNDQMSRRALRTLGFAFREIPLDELETHRKKNGTFIFEKENIETNLVFLGLAGMMDPPRPEVKNAVEMAHRAGIRTYIITGDHGLTAEAIAKKLNIIGGKRHRIITGAELNSIPDKDLLNELGNHSLDIIFARVTPEHKLRIVKLLKQLGEVVAVTGDGVNDAPALKRADIGIAMGITGTDVSKEAANMILADDSYSTIVFAIKEGRTIYDNLKKFVFYIFSCNIGELVTIFFGIILNVPLPLTTSLILCINVGTDILPAVALGVDPTEPGIMDRKPRNPHQKIMDKSFILHYTYLGIVIGGIVMVIYILTLYRYGWSWGKNLDNNSLTYLKSATIAFALLVMIQMANAFNSRSKKYSIFTLGLFSNHALLGAIMLSLFFTIAVTQIPFLQEHLHTTSLDVIDWLIVIGGSSLIIVTEEIRKIFYRYYWAK